MCIDLASQSQANSTMGNLQNIKQKATVEYERVRKEVGIRKNREFLVVLLYSRCYDPQGDRFISLFSPLGCGFGAKGNRSADHDANRNHCEGLPNRPYQLGHTVGYG